MSKTTICYVNKSLTGKDLFSIISNATLIEVKQVRIIFQGKEIYPIKEIINYE